MFFYGVICKKRHALKGRRVEKFVKVYGLACIKPYNFVTGDGQKLPILV